MQFKTFFNPFLFGFMIVFGCLTQNVSAQTSKTDTAQLRKQIIEYSNSYNIDSLVIAIDSFMKIDATQWDILDISTLRYINVEDPQKAFQTAQQAVKYAPADLKTVLIAKYGFMYFNERQDYKAASQYFDIGIKNYPSDWRSFAGMGLCETMQENFAQSEQHFSAALKLTSDTAITPSLFIAYAYALHRNGKSEQGLEYTNRFLSICQADYCAQGYVVRQEIYKDKKEYDKALKDINTLLSMHNDDGRFYEMKADLYDAMGKPELAIEAAEKAELLGSRMALDSFAVKYATPLSTLPLKAGTKLVYQVGGTDQPHELILTLETISLQKIVFSYKFGNDEEMFGTFEMGKNALESARNFHNFFMGNGENLTLEKDSIAFFASRLMLKELHNNKKTSLDPFANNENIVFQKSKERENAFKINGKYHKIKSIVCMHENDENIYLFTIANDVNFPLILQLEMGWSLHLVRIE